MCVEGICCLSLLVVKKCMNANMQNLIFIFTIMLFCPNTRAHENGGTVYI